MMFFPFTLLMREAEWKLAEKTKTVFRHVRNSVRLVTRIGAMYKNRIPMMRFTVPVDLKSPPSALGIGHDTAQGDEKFREGSLKPAPP
jgi:hypothetical protein